MADAAEEPKTTPRKRLWDQIKADPEASDRVTNAILKELLPYTPLVLESVKRVNKLLSTASRLTNPPSLRPVPLDDQTREAAQDILRASVVLLHAYLEDFLRTIARALLPSGDEKCLSSIPLAGQAGRAEKFSLGKLVSHKGKTVEEVIRQSVSEHLDRSNYSSITEIATLLETLGFDVAQHDEQFDLLDQMIQRRHNIVHRADRVKEVDSGNYVLQPILDLEVQLWLKATTVFMSNLLGPLVTKLNPIEELAKKLNIKLIEESTE